MSTAIVEVQSAVAEFDKVAAGLEVLKETYAGVVYDVRTSKGMDEAKAARAAIREPRYEIERVRKAAKAPILKLGKELDARAKEITEQILAIESPIDEQIKNEEARKEREKQAKIEAEQRRVSGIQARIDAIRNWPSNAAGKPASLVEQQLRNATDYVIGEEFEEFADAARSVLEASTAALKGILAERVAHEAEQERITAEREELARLRAEQEKREAAERERLAEEERKAKAEREAEAAKIAAELAAERKRIAEEEAAAKAARDAEAAKLAAERAEFERQQAEARRIKEEEERAERERARLAAIKKPTDKELINVLAQHYNVPASKVVEWILAMDLAQEKAA